ncbi:MAG TPA: hypothetical protein VLH77_04090 [Gammaproteobacteria bacterium]|nr:hypothetical protein [Gammaproteobacteria bacterium]
MMEFETWPRDTLIKELKKEQTLADTRFNGDFLGLLTLKLYSDKEIAQKTDYELRRIYVQLKKDDATFFKEYNENEEKKRFFNQPSSNADFNYWSKQAYWSTDEGIALILGKDPRKVTWEKVETYLSASPFAQKFNEIRELAKRYVNCKELSGLAFPGTFLAWVKRMSIDIPPELEDTVSSLGVQIADWKGCYEKAIEKFNHLNNLFTEQHDFLKAKDKIIEAQKLMISEIEKNGPQPKAASDLKESERQSLYKLLAAMAYNGYGYVPTDKKSPCPKEISDAVTEYLGEKIDPDTARKWLKAATEAYPNQISSKTE